VPSPRAAKRLVNLYRIARASLDEDELARFVGGRFRVMQLLLAAVVGHASLAAELFEGILGGALRDRAALDAFLDRRVREDRRWADLGRLFRGREELADWDAVRQAARSAARYSFETGRILHASAAAPGEGRPVLVEPPRPPEGAALAEVPLPS
jgi:hypothetical protein